MKLLLKAPFILCLSSLAWLIMASVVTLISKPAHTAKGTRSGTPQSTSAVKCCQCKCDGACPLGSTTCFTQALRVRSGGHKKCAQLCKELPSSLDPACPDSSFRLKATFFGKKETGPCPNEEQTCDKRLESIREAAENRRLEYENFANLPFVSHELKELWGKSYKCPPNGSHFDVVYTARPFTFSNSDPKAKTLADKIPAIAGANQTACLAKRGWTLSTEKIGKGQFGDVFKVSRSGSGKTYVAKRQGIMLPGADKIKAYRAQRKKMTISATSFIMETDFQNKAARMGISVPIIDAFVCLDSDGAVPNVMGLGFQIVPFVGGTLKNLLKSQAKLADGIPIKQSILGLGGISGKLTDQQLGALRTLVLTAHQLGLLAMDAHFENILYDPDLGRFVLIDFGLAGGEPGQGFFSPLSDIEDKSKRPPLPTTPIEVLKLETQVWEKWARYGLGITPSAP